MADSDAKKIIEMEALEARTATLKSESYFDVDLPDYFDFEPMLKGLSEKIGGQPLSNFWKSKPGEQDGVNHVILHNKDGKFAWRPQELIYPALVETLKVVSERLTKYFLRKTLAEEL